MKHQKLLSVSTVTMVLARKFMVLHRSAACSSWVHRL